MKVIVPIVVLLAQAAIAQTGAISSPSPKSGSTRETQSKEFRRESRKTIVDPG